MHDWFKSAEGYELSGMNWCIGLMRSGLRDEKGREMRLLVKTRFRLVDESPMCQVAFFHETLWTRRLNMTGRSLSHFLPEAGLDLLNRECWAEMKEDIFVPPLQPALECGPGNADTNGN